jgi:hypothetical protein
MDKRRVVIALVSIAVVALVVVVALNAPDFVAGFRDGLRQ